MSAAWITSFVLASVAWGVLLWVILRTSARAARYQAQLGAAFEYLHLLEAVFEAAQSAIAATATDPRGATEDARGRLSSAVAAVETFEICRLPSYRHSR